MSMDRGMESNGRTDRTGKNTHNTSSQGSAQRHEKERNNNKGNDSKDRSIGKKE